MAKTATGKLPDYRFVPHQITKARPLHHLRLQGTGRLGRDGRPAFNIHIWHIAAMCIRKTAVTMAARNDCAYLNANRLQACKKSVIKIGNASGRKPSGVEGGVTGVTWREFSLPCVAW